MLERCNELQETFVHKQGFAKQPSSKAMMSNEQSPALATLQNKDNIDLLNKLLQLEHTPSYVPNQLTKKGRKRRKKRISKRL